MIKITATQAISNFLKKVSNDAVNRKRVTSAAKQVSSAPPLEREDTSVSQEEPIDYANYDENLEILNLIGTGHAPEELVKQHFEEFKHGEYLEKTK